MKNKKEFLESVFEKEGFTLKRALGINESSPLNFEADPAIKRIMFAMEQYAKQFKNEWISVKEQLPPIGEEVLIMEEKMNKPDSKSYFVGSYEKDLEGKLVWWQGDVEYISDSYYDITNWKYIDK